MILERKQKIYSTLIIFAISFLTWQLYDIFLADISNSTNHQVKSVAKPGNKVVTKTLPLMTKPLSPSKPVVINPLPIPPGAPKTNPDATNIVKPLMVDSSSNYQLMYVDYENSQWTATLNRNGRVLEVQKDTLLSDGSDVMKIDQSGVVINQKGKTYLINFYGTEPIRVHAETNKLIADANIASKVLYPVPPVNQEIILQPVPPIAMNLQKQPQVTPKQVVKSITGKQ